MNGLADHAELIARLEELGRGDSCTYKVQRRQKVARYLEQLRQERMTGR